MVSFDCSKAFDSISHPELLQRLENMGMSTQANQWFENYLTERQQCTSIETKMSKCKSINYGVPQGSVLGGLLFCLFVDPLLSLIQIPREMYIDDLTVYHSFKTKDVQQNESYINQQCTKILSWYCANDLQLNPKKTKCMIFGPSKAVDKVKETICIQINGSKVEPSKNIKLLGVTLDSKLSYADHIEDTTAECSRLLYRINRVRSLLTRSAVDKIISATVMSRMMYCSTILTTANKDSIHTMQCVQNFAAKIITQNYLCTNLTPTYKRLKWLRIKDMMEERVIL